MAKGFLFGGNTPWTADELKRKRAIADALLAQNMRSPQNVGEGLTAIGRALAARKINKRADAREGELRDESQARFNALFSGGGSGFGASGGSYGGGSYTPAPPPSQFNMGETETPEQKAAREAASMGSWNGGAVSDMQPNMVSTFGQDTPGMGKSGYNMGTDAPQGGMALDLIKGFEGFRETPYWDVNALRTGYGSDTVTLPDGTVKRVTDGTRVSREDADRDLARRVETEFKPLAAGAVGESFNLLSEPQQAALTSIAYNYGELPSSVATAVKTPGIEDDVSAIRALASHNNGINAGRRNQEADLYASGAGGAAVGGAAPRVDPLMFGQMSDPQPQPVQGGGAGGQSPGFIPTGGGMDMGALVTMMSDPYISDGQKAILNTLLNQQLQGMDPMYQMQLQEQQLKLAEMQGGGQGMRPMTPDEMAQWGIPPNSGAWGIGPDGTPKQIMEAPVADPAKPLTDVAKLNADLKAGLISQEAYDAEIARRNKAAPPAATMTLADGTVVTVGGDVPGGKLTEGQSKDVGFYGRMTGVSPKLDELETALTEFGSNTGSKVPLVGNYLQSENFRQAKTAAGEWIAGLLRKDTGAAVTPQEFEYYGSIYLPQPGDDEQTIAMKREARKRAEQGIKDGLGTAAVVGQFIDQRNADTSAPPAGLTEDDMKWLQ